MKSIKAVTSLFITLVALTMVPSALALTNNHDYTDNSQLPILVEDDTEIGLMADHMHMSLPIADAGFVSNYQLGQMIEKQRNGIKALDILNDVIFFSGIGSPIGLMNSLVGSLLDKGPSNDLLEAYYTGKDMYWVAVYANGVKPSLTTNGFHVFSDTRVIFTDDHGWGGR